MYNLSSQSVECPACRTRSIIRVPDEGGMAVTICPRCRNRNIYFFGLGLPVDRSHGPFDASSPEALRKSLSESLARFVEGLPDEILEDLCRHMPGPVGDPGDRPITGDELDLFSRQLHDLDDAETFRRIFGSPS